MSTEVRLMRVELSSPIEAEVCGYLLNGNPNVPKLQSVLEDKLSPEEARELIYNIALKVNASIFPPITKMELMLTEGCNLGCSYCFEKNILGYKKMPLDIAFSAVDMFLDYSINEKELQLTHFGGEPTINFEAIKAVTEYAEKQAMSEGKHVSFNTTSNGVLLNDEMVDYFHEHDICVLLSIDGLAETHDRYRRDRKGNGTFLKVINGMKILKQKQKWIGIKMTVMPENVKSLYNDVLGLYELGVNQFVIGPASGIKWLEEDIRAFGFQLGKVYEWYKENRGDDLRITEFEELRGKQGEDFKYFGCQAGRNSISVAVNGEISPCSKILGIDNKQLLSKLGDVRYGLTYFRNRHQLNSNSKLRSACESAGVNQDFNGGCYVMNFEETGDLFKPSIQAYRLDKQIRMACSACH